VASPRHAERLVDYFKSHITTQDHGLDDIGSTVSSAKRNNAITMEIVQGKREELYWDRVPEKVRKQTVQKAVNAKEQLNGNDGSQTEGQLDALTDETSGTKRRKRKRDK